MTPSDATTGAPDPGGAARPHGAKHSVTARTKARRRAVEILFEADQRGLLRDERGGAPGRGDYPVRGGRDEYGERDARSAPDERPARSEYDEYPARGERDEHSVYDAPGEYDGRPAYDEYGARGGYGGRDEYPVRDEYDVHGEYDERDGHRLVHGEYDERDGHRLVHDEYDGRPAYDEYGGVAAARAEESGAARALRDLAAERAEHSANHTPAPAYAREILAGVADHLAEVDEAIETYAQGWALARMPAVDRAIARVATWEIVWNDDVDAPVAVDEAITLARMLSTDDSPRYLSGLLGRIGDLADTLR